MAKGALMLAIGHLLKALASVLVTLARPSGHGNQPSGKIAIWITFRLLWFCAAYLILHLLFPSSALYWALVLIAWRLASEAALNLRAVQEHVRDRRWAVLVLRQFAEISGSFAVAYAIMWKLDARAALLFAAWTTCIGVNIDTGQIAACTNLQRAHSLVTAICCVAGAALGHSLAASVAELRHNALLIAAACALLVGCAWPMRHWTERYAERLLERWKLRFSASNETTVTADQSGRGQ